MSDTDPELDRGRYNSDHEQAMAQKLVDARVILPLVGDLMPVRSVLDVVCGFGAFLAVWREMGVENCLGVEGDWIERERLIVPGDLVLTRNLERPLGPEVPDGFDLAMCLEVAEHLSEDRSAGIVADLVERAPVVLFSAAIPGQGGTGHINEQWHGYWVKRFRRQGYERINALRPALWDNRKVSWWYSQNAMLFASWNALESLPALRRAADMTAALPDNLVHPAMYALRCR